MPATYAHPRPWHAGSDFQAGPRRPMDRNDRARWIWRVEAERLAGRLPALQADCARYFLKFLGKDGRLDPAHATIAKRARASARTVQRAMAFLAACGLLRWARRLVSVPWPQGGRGARRVEQTSNAYEVLLPALPGGNRPASAALNTGGQSGREASFLLKKEKEKRLVREEAAGPVPPDAAEARAALAKVAAERGAKNGHGLIWTTVPSCR